MKRLTDYIYENKIEQCIIDCSNLSSTAKTFYYDVFNESYIKGSNHWLVFEKAGTYNGQIKFAVDIAKELYRDLKYNKILKYIRDTLIDRGLENIFFKDIVIVYSPTKNSYYNARENFDNDSKLFDEVKIYINSEENRDYKDILTSLVHELTHAWEDYNRHLDGVDSLYKLTNKDSKYAISSLEDYNAEEVEDILKELVKKFDYLSTSFERNAYASELRAYLEANREDIHGYNDALKVFYGSDIFKELSMLIETFETYQHSDAIKRIAAEQYNLLFSKYRGKDIKYNQFWKRSLRHLYDIKEKLSKNLAKIYYDFYTSEISDIKEFYSSKEHLETLTERLNFIKEFEKI